MYSAISAPDPSQAASLANRRSTASGHVLAFLWALACRARPELSRRNLGRRLEYLLRLLPVAPWLQPLRDVVAHERLQFLQPLLPVLFDKLHHPYQDKRWGIGRRVNAISAHYHWMLDTFDQRTLESIYLPGGITLAQVGPVESPYRISLSFDRSFSKEGELMLMLFDASGQRMATLAFAVSENPHGKRLLRIGGLQGDRGASREQFKKLTKDCHGLRPLALLVAVAQALATQWKLERVYGISNDQHIFVHRRYWRRRHLRVQRSYDELWQELGGETAGGWFRLPSQPEVRDPSDAPSNKRAMYVRRKAMMEALQQQTALNWRDGAQRLTPSTSQSTTETA